MKSVKWWRSVVALLFIVVAAPSLAQVGLIKIVYGFAAGGSGDLTARLLADHMRTSLGQPVIVENKVGAGGRIAVETVKMAAPDGTTVLITPMGPMAILPHTVGKLRYDPFKDFEPVAHIEDSQLVLAVGSAVTAKTVAEYVAQAKKDSKLGFFGVAPLGGLPHFLGLHFASLNGIDMTAVSYKGNPQMLQALLSGEVPAAYTTPSDLIPLHKSGKLRILAVSGAKRLASLPDVPTLREAGHDIEASTWFAMFAPAGTPAATVERLARAVNAAVNEPAINTRLSEIGFDPTGYGPAELGRTMKRDYDRWGPVIKASGYNTAD